MKRLLFAFATLLAALTAGAAAAAPTSATQVSLSGQADFITAFNLVAYVTVQGESPTGLGTVTVTIQQAQPPLGSATGTGSRQIICDGQRRQVAVGVSGGFPAGFNLGEAQGFASATCSTTGSDADTQSVRITKP